jgi:hypothetical protein
MLQGQVQLLSAVFLSVIVKKLAGENSCIVAVPFITELSILASIRRLDEESSSVAIDPFTVTEPLPLTLTPWQLVNR